MTTSQKESVIWIKHFLSDLDGLAITINREPNNEDYFGHLGWIPENTEETLCMTLERAFNETIGIKKGSTLICEGNHLSYYKRKFVVIATEYKKGMSFIDNGSKGMLRDVTPRDANEIKKFLSETNCKECKEALDKNASLEAVKEYHDNCHGHAHCPDCNPGECEVCGE